MRAVPLRPDGTQVATRPPSATASGEAALASDIAKLPAKLAPKAASETAGIAEASTPNLDSPAKLSGKSSARVMVAGIDTIAPSAAMETPSQQVQLGAPVKSEKAAKIALKAPQAAVEPQAARPAPRASTQSPLILWRVSSPNLLAPWPRPPAGPFNWPRQNRRPKPRATSRGSTQNIRPCSTARQSPCRRPKSKARPSIVCASSACSRPMRRRFARASRAKAATASSPRRALHRQAREAAVG